MGVKVTGQFEPAGEFSIVDAKDVSGNITSSNIQLSGNISGSTTSTGSFGHLIIKGNITASGTVRADAFESLTGGETIDFGDSVNVSGNVTANNLTSDSASFSTRVTNLKTNSGSFSTRVTAVTSSISALKTDSGSFSTRVTAITSSISALKSNSGSFSTRVTKNEGTGSKILTGGLEFTNITFTGNITGSSTSTGSVAHLHISNNIGVGTLSPLATVHISASDGLIIPVGNNSQRSGDAIVGEIRFNTDAQTYEGYDGNNWGSLGGMTDVDKDTLITAENSAGVDNDELKFFTAGVERLRISSTGILSASGDIKTSDNLEVRGNISSSLTSTGSFGMVKNNGLDIREHFTRNISEAFELDSNGDFQPVGVGKYIIDKKFDYDKNGDLQLRERELWTLFSDDYFSD